MSLEILDYDYHDWWVRPGSTDEHVIYECWLGDQYRLVGRVAGGVVLDLGANIGAFSLRALHEGASSVVAFEPEPDNLEVLRANCGAELDSGRLILVQRAVWSESDQMLSMRQAGGGSAVMVGGDGTVEVPTLSLSDALRMVEGTIAYLKIDIEGSEVEAILSTEVSEWERVAYLGMEYHGWPDDSNRWALMIRHLTATFDLEVLSGDPPLYVGGGMIFGRNRRLEAERAAAAAEEESDDPPEA